MKYNEVNLEKDGLRARKAKREFVWAVIVVSVLTAVALLCATVNPFYNSVVVNPVPTDYMPRIAISIIVLIFLWNSFLTWENNEFTVLFGGIFMLILFVRFPYTLLIFAPLYVIYYLVITMKENKQRKAEIKKDLLFFHNSDSLIKSFSLETEPWQKASYYWLNTHYHHYQPWNPQYFYLFLKKPKTDNIKFFVRNGGELYDTLMSQYKKHVVAKKERAYHEPPILMSNDKIIPDLIADAGPGTTNKTRVWTIVKPVEHKGKTIELFNENHEPINFNDIPLLNTIFPNLSQSIPFVLPAEYDEWNGITYEKLIAKK